MEKRKLFKIALTVAGITIDDFARENCVSRRSIERAINEGDKFSARINKSISQFIKEKLSMLKIQMERAA